MPEVADSSHPGPDWEPIGEFIGRGLLKVLSGHGSWEMDFYTSSNEGTVTQRGFVIAGTPPVKRGNPLSDSWKSTLRVTISDYSSVGLGEIAFERHLDFLRENAWITDANGAESFLPYRLFSTDAPVGEITSRLLNVLVPALELDPTNFYVLADHPWQTEAVVGLERYMELPLFGIERAIFALTEATRGRGGITLEELYYGF